MTDWTAIEDANPSEGDMALIIADRAGDWGLVPLLPQLCAWEVDENGSGYWVQMLRGNVYGLKVDGTPRLYMPISLPTSSSGATS